MCGECARVDIGRGMESDPHGGSWSGGIFIENDEHFRSGLVALEQCPGIEALL